MIEFTCFCDECEKSVPVSRVRISKTGYVMIWLVCGHTTGFVFDAKLVPMEKTNRKKGE